MCDVKSLLLLGLNKMEWTPVNTFNVIAPFANEITNVLVISGVLSKMFYNHHAPGDKITIGKLFDIIALIGISSNAATYARKYNYKLGLVKATLFIIFSFMIPNLFMHKILDNEYLKNKKLLAGFIIIYLN